MNRSLTIALAGNANVGKSCIFNKLTGLSQVVGNWPGKTVEKVEGTLYFQGYKIRVIDLPGTYSLSAYSAEEVVVRDYLLSREADVVIDVVDASALERNLYLTLQLMELQVPLVIALNQVDMAEKKGLIIDHEELSRLLGVKVIPTIAITGKGLNELLQAVIEVIEKGDQLVPKVPTYGREVEEKINCLEENVKKLEISKKYPPRWLSIKLLERDPLVLEIVSKGEGGAEVVKLADELISELEEVHGESSPIIMAAERYAKIAEIISKAQRIVATPRVKWERIFDYVTTHPVLGYLVLFSVIAGMLSLVFYFGGLLSEVIESYIGGPLIAIIEALLQALPLEVVNVVTRGLVTGFVAGFVIILPFIIPFYVILSILEDTGYLPRAAYLTDSLMHKIGLHGKALLPILLGFGCNVPACLGCRILETDRERYLCGLAVTFVPCAARTVVILGLVGMYVGIIPALSIYLIAFTIIFLVTKLAYKVVPGEPMDLIMEMPPYRKPSLKVVALKTWSKTKSFAAVAFPIIVAGSLVLEMLRIMNLMDPIVSVMKPLTVGLLGLPAEAAVPLIFGFLRKELALIMLAEALGTYNLPLVMTLSQMYVFALVVAIYIPCIATFAALIREFGWNRALLISLTTLVVAMLAGTLAHIALATLGL
ncbi:MAG: ferrous iron transport protein B [Candidatus Nezhaarchaeales archaeon]|nr:MAG: ferrous iron transport protein B [Candidatus Nezhaarchaeota archaeon WYZ-LMO7]